MSLALKIRLFYAILIIVDKGKLREIEGRKATDLTPPVMRFWRRMVAGLPKDGEEVTGVPLSA